MRNKFLYVYTENLSFFYRLNKELNRLNIKFKILSGKSKIPDISTLFLTTKEELNNLKRNYKKLRLLPYDDMENFSCYILKILAAYRVNFKDFYSELTFSIDPGSKRIGMVVILDDYFLNSHTFYDINEFTDNIKDYIKCFQGDDPNQFNLTFKFGSGVLQLTPNIIETVLNHFQRIKKLKIYLIDESNSSKIKIRDKFGKKFPKDEASALILALRSGIEINKSNYSKIFEQKKTKKLRKNDIKEEYFQNKHEIANDLKSIAESVLNGEISFNDSLEILKNRNTTQDISNNRIR